MEQPENYKTNLNQTRTFSSDLAKAVREKGGSVVRIAIAEEEKHRQEFEDTNKSAQNKYVAMTILIIVVTIMGIYFLYNSQQNTNQIPVQEAPLPQAMILSEEATNIEDQGMQVNDFLSAIRTKVNDTSLRDGTVENIVVTQSQTRISAGQFMSLIKAHSSIKLDQTLAKEYMLGVEIHTGNNLFLILRGTAHDFMLSGMLDWESYMMGDLAPLFGIDDQTATYQNTPFHDKLIQNHDTRALVDNTGNPILFYSFLDPNTVIITNSPEALDESIRRF